MRESDESFSAGKNSHRKKNSEKRVGIRRTARHTEHVQEGNGPTSEPQWEGGGSVTVLETIGLLNLLAVVIFGVIQAMKKK